jgi:hypothetical protein
MPPEADRPVRWRALAAEAFAVAEEMSDLVAKQIMLAIAEKYRELAERAERRRDEHNPK